MDPKEMGRISKQMIDFVSEYWEGLRAEKRYSAFFKPLGPSILNEIPEKPPETPVAFDRLIGNIKTIILPQVHHWQSPLYFAYFPANTSFASVAAEILIAGIGGVSFGWSSNPGFVDLEDKVTDWLAQAAGLPEKFMNSRGGQSGGGGAIHQAASESTLLAFVIAKKRMIASRPLLSRQNRFVAFGSELAHCSVEKTCLLLDVEYRPVRVDYKFRMVGSELQKEIDRCLREGKIPLIVVATLGTTSVCSSDDLESIGKVCENRRIWLHVDAAYAGAALTCPELRHIGKGMEKVDSFSFSLHNVDI